jgi:hypothetical protein
MSLRRLSLYALISAICFVGLAVRTHRIWSNAATQELGRFDGEPLPVNLDAYRYLQQAQTLIDSEYRQTKIYRSLPTAVLPPRVPPLIAVMMSGVQRTTGASLLWVGALLPPFLAILLALPMYWLAREIGGRFAGIVAVASSLVSGYFVMRSGLAWIDTDCLIPFFSLAIPCCSLLATRTSGVRRMSLLLSAVLLYGLFLWWWEQCVAIVSLLSLPPLLVALLVVCNGKFMRLAVAGGVVLIAGLLLAVQWGDLPSIRGQFIDQLQLTLSLKSSELPRMGNLTQELRHSSVSESAHLTMGNMPTFLLAWIGLVALIFKRPQTMMFLAAPFVLALLPMFSSERFLIFQAPMLALGLAYLASLAWMHRLSLGRSGPYIVIAGILLTIVPSVTNAWTQTTQPREDARTVDGLIRTRASTTSNSVVWAWWDHGYAINYWSKRSTVNDGGSAFDALRTVCNAVPFANSSPRVSANFVAFFLKHGTTGIHILAESMSGTNRQGMELLCQLLGAGPDSVEMRSAFSRIASSQRFPTIEEWEMFLFPPLEEPAYLFLDGQLPFFVDSWFTMGSWGAEAASTPDASCRMFYLLSQEGSLITGSDGLSIDLERKTVTVPPNAFPLGSITRHDGTQLATHEFLASGVHFEMHAPLAFGALMGYDLADSTFNKLFIRHTRSAYFEPVLLGAPYFQLWRVRPDGGDKTPKTEILSEL